MILSQDRDHNSLRSCCWILDEGAGNSEAVSCSCQHPEQAVQTTQGAAADTDIKGRPEGNACQAEGGTGSTAVNAE